MLFTEHKKCLICLSEPECTDEYMKNSIWVLDCIHFVLDPAKADVDNTVTVDN